MSMPRPIWLRDHRGVTLIELLVTLVVVGIVSAAVYQVIGGQIRVTERLSAREAVQQNARAALELISSELRGVPAGGVLTAESDAIQFRSPRVWGVICATEPDLYVAFPAIDGVNLFSDVSVAIDGVPGPGAEVESATAVESSDCEWEGDSQPAFGQVKNWPGGAVERGATVYLYRTIGYRIQNGWIQRGRAGAGGGSLAWEGFAGPMAEVDPLTFEYHPNASPSESIDRIKVRVRAADRGEVRTDSALVFLRPTEF